MDPGGFGSRCVGGVSDGTAEAEGERSGGNILVLRRSKDKCARRQSVNPMYWEARAGARRGPGAYFTFMPGSAPASGLSKKRSRPPGPAASTMPSETPKRILRGARLATITVRRPTSPSGA